MHPTLSVATLLMVCTDPTSQLVVMSDARLSQELNNTNNNTWPNASLWNILHQVLLVSADAI